MYFYDLKQKTGYSRSEFKTLLKRNGFSVKRNMFTDGYYTTRKSKNGRYHWVFKHKHTNVGVESDGFHYAIWKNKDCIFRLQRYVDGGLAGADYNSFNYGDIVVHTCHNFEVVKFGKWKDYDVLTISFDDFVKKYCSKNLKHNRHA